MRVMSVNGTDIFILHQLKAMPVPKFSEQLQKKIFSSFYKLCSVDKLLHKTKKIFKSQESIERILVIIASLQQIFVSAQDELDETKKRLLKEKFSIERNKIEAIFNSLFFSNDEEKLLRDSILENIKLLNKEIVVVTTFDDQRVFAATDFVKKEGGINPGYTITNPEGTRFTIKQGNTLGHTLSEVFSSMVLSEIVKLFDTGKSLTLIANAFLVVKALDDSEKCGSIEYRCRTALYASSQWSQDSASFKACEIFGLKNRVIAAGTRKAEDFEDLRAINAACDLGLETIVIPTSLVVDFDLHTENYLLKINDSLVKDEHKDQVKFHIQLLEQEMKKTTNVSRAARVMYLKGIITILKELGSHIYFQKIDHDNGFYRYADPVRRVDFSTHRTSPLYRTGTQPTLHITEITGGTKEGFDQLMLSDKGIERLLKINLDVQQAIVSKVSGSFFKLIYEKSMVIADKGNEQQRISAEFYLLNEFLYHIAEINIPTPKEVNDNDITNIKKSISEKLELGTKLKVKDLYEQVYERLLEKEKINTLTAKQLELKSCLVEQDYLRTKARTSSVSL